MSICGRFLATALWAVVFFTFMRVEAAAVQCGGGTEDTAHSRTFAYEYTRQSGELIIFYNLVDEQHDVAVRIYNPSGSLHSTQTVTLRGYETVTINDAAVEWSLPRIGRKANHDLGS